MISHHKITTPRRRISSLLFLSLISGLFVQQAVGQAAKPEPDMLVFSNGDQLTGTLERGVGDSVVFKSDIVGEVTVPLAKIKELRSNGGFVVLKNGEKVTRTAKRPGQITYADNAISVKAPSSPVETVPVKDLAYIIDDATYNKEVTGNPRPLQGWNGSITGGATLVQATQYGENFTAGIALIRAIPTVPFLPARTRTTFNLLETYGKLTQPTIPQTTPATPDAVAKTSIFHTDFEHDKYISPRLYGFAGVSFDHNFSQGLNFQQIYGVGIGWTAIKDAKQELDVKGDIHYEKQAFINPAPTLTDPDPVITPNQNLIGSTFAELYSRTLPAKILFTESASYIIGWNDFNAYSAIFAAGVQLPVYKRFAMNVSATDNYLNNPAFGYDKNSFQFVTGITYTLK
jgi:Protein of unknown function, DUF481